MHGCSARIIALSAALALAVGVLGWSVSTISSSVSALFPSDADNQAIQLSLQRQELVLEQERADWERSQAEADALLPAIVAAKTALLFLGIVAIAGLLAIAADLYLCYRRQRQPQQVRYLLIDRQPWLLTSQTPPGQAASQLPGTPSPVPAVPARRAWAPEPPVDLDPVWTDYPARYEQEDEIGPYPDGQG
jgi:hypothetical protein